MNLFFNSNTDASSSNVNSLSDNSTKSLPELYLGDSLPIDITFTDGNGGYAFWNGENNLSVKIAIGVLGLNRVYVLQDQFTFSNNKYSGTLVLFTETMANALNGVESIDAVFEVQVQRSIGQSITIHQSSVTIQNQLIGDSTIHPTLDSDGDGVPNELESNDPKIGQSLNTLNSYVTDSLTPLQAGDVIKILFQHTKKNKTFLVNEYFLVYAVTSLGNPRIIFENEEYFFTENRGIYWEKVVPAPDTDNDGVPDTLDAFPNDASEQFDTDNDGVGNNADAFPQNPNESVDTDNDGVGDNADAFPIDPFESKDTDADGVGDNADAFPEDSTETADTDSDGIGDNADAFPNDASETTDTDADGVGDNADEFPNDASETTDTDSDGVGDNADAFPNDPDETTDTDGDGVGDNSDGDPNDPNVTSSPAYFIYGDDGVNGNGYYYPVYTNPNGLGSYHTHTIQGVVVYMEDADANHSQTGLPYNNTYQKVPNTTAPDTDGDGKEDWEDYFSNDSSADVSKAELDGYSLDTHRPVASNLYIRILNNFTTGSGSFLSQGEYYISTGYSLASNSVKLTIGGYDSWLTSGRGTDWEIVNPSSNIYNPPATDSDGDGVNDSTDYFPNDANYTQTKAELDAYSLDTYKTPAIGDILKIISNYNMGGVIFEQGTYHIVLNVNQGTNVKIAKDGSNYHPNFNQRSTKWEIVNPSNNLAPDPSTALNSYVVDTYLDTAVTDPTGRYIRVLEDFTSTGTNFTSGEHYEILGIDNTSTQDLEVDVNGSTIVILQYDRPKKWEIIADANNVTARNPQKGATDLADILYFGNTGNTYRKSKFGDITRHYHNSPIHYLVDVDLDFNNKDDGGFTDFEKITGTWVGTAFDENSNPDTALYRTSPESVYNMVCVNAGSTGSPDFKSFADLKYAGSKLIDALPTEEGGNSTQDTLSTEYTNNLRAFLALCVNDDAVLTGGQSSTNARKLALYINGIKEPYTEFLSYNTSTSGVIQIITDSNRIQAGDYVQLLREDYTLAPSPELLKETYSPRTFFYDAVEKVYYNNAEADIISVDQNAFTIDLDTTGNGTSDTTLDIQWGRKYDYYTNQDTAIYDVTPPQIFKQKVTSVYNGYGYTLFKTWNIDRGDYVVGSPPSDNADSIRVTRNLMDFVTNVDNDVAVLSAGSGGTGKTAYFSHNGTPLNIYGVENASDIAIRVNTSNSTLLSVGDIVEFYIA